MKKKKVIILILLTGLIILLIQGAILNGYAIINVLDAKTNKYVEGISISLFPRISMIASPGTGATGAYLYSPIFPTPVLAKIKAPQYKDESKFLILWKGRDVKIHLKPQ